MSPSSPRSSSSSVLDPGRRRSRGGRRRRTLAGWLRAHGFASALNALENTTRRTRALVYRRWVLLLPVFAFLLVNETDFLVLLHASDAASIIFQGEMPITELDERRDGAESTKKKVQALIYLLTLGLAFVHRRPILGYLRDQPHLALMLLWLIGGTLYGNAPVKVFTNTILSTIGVLLAILCALAQRRDGLRWHHLYVIVFLATFVLNAASLGLLLFYDVSIDSFFSGGQRYGGFSGSPNALGAVAVIGVWGATSLLASAGTGRTLRWLATAGLVIFGFHIVLSGSATSLGAALIVVVVFLWLRLLAVFGSATRLVMNIGAAAVGVATALVLLMLYTPFEMLEIATGSVGKETTLTGRTDIWPIALQAIAESPWVGYSFDSHFTVKSHSEFDIPYNHYHNGFLDVVVGGGLVLLAFVLYNMVSYVFAFRERFRVDSTVFPLIMPLMMVVVLNLSEYSLLRPLGSLWQVYLCAFVLLTLRYERLTKPRSARRSGRSSGRRVIRWG